VVVFIASGLFIFGFTALVPGSGTGASGRYIIGIGYLVVSFGLFKGKGWAWPATLILSYIGIALAIIFVVSGNFLSAINLAINIAIVYFLYRPQVKAFFGKSPSAKI
jgi:hypothetical protein